MTWVKRVEKTLNDRPWLMPPGNNQLRAATLIPEARILPSPRQIPPPTKRTKDDLSGTDMDVQPTIGYRGSEL